ncbi:hypothetical protein EC40967_2279 [Escherichia coli 4.0967]|uniref:Uncharacterized protein n=1 Tax=Escherichia coli 4.0967 TaxID=869687 RepID=A0AAN3V565_ECOLX|nr:hypothetical protein EC40967_2279 [Escherichia coli 4.0967]
MVEEAGCLSLLIDNTEMDSFDFQHVFVFVLLNICLFYF